MIQALYRPTDGAIELDKLSLVHSNGFKALTEVSLTIQGGERVAIIGSSGAGKTSLLSILGTGLKPSTGSYRFQKNNPWEVSREKLRQLRAQIGFIYQAPPLPPRQRVITTILAGKLGQWPAWKSLLSLLYPADIDGPARLLERLQLSEALFTRNDTLSGGELQRIGIARTLYQDPAIILADEPISALDPVLSELVIQQLLANKEKTIIVSLHDVEVALKWFPRIIGLRDGQVQFDLPATLVTKAMLRELYASEQIFFE